MKLTQMHSKRGFSDHRERRANHATALFMKRTCTAGPPAAISKLNKYEKQTLTDAHMYVRHCKYVCMYEGT